VAKSSYLRGIELLGANDAKAGGAGMATGAALNSPYVLVQVKDVAGLVKAQGGVTGGLGSAAMLYGPTAKLVTDKVYDTLREQLAAALKDKGVDASVTVAYAPSTAKPPSSGFLSGLAVGGVAVGGGVLLWRYVLRGLFTRNK
jgi:hypothetical protein